MCAALRDRPSPALMTANPTTAPQDRKTDELVRHLRTDVLPATVQGTNAHALLTGQALVTPVYR